MKGCIYAGVFDPPHAGHENVIARLLSAFDFVIVAVLKNADKKPVLDEGARARLLQSLYADDERVKVRVFNGLLTDFAKEEGVYTIARGLRSAADYEYEKQLAAVYKSQNPQINVIYLPADPALTHVSSSVVKELIKLGGDISGYVTATILDEIKRSYK